MNIKFANEEFACRKLEIYPSRFRIGDILILPGGNLLRVLTVQTGCPYWESNHRVFTMILLETEDHTKIPTRDLSGKIPVYRPKVSR